MKGVLRFGVTDMLLLFDAFPGYILKSKPKTDLLKQYKFPTYLACH